MNSFGIFSILGLVQLQCAVAVQVHAALGRSSDFKENVSSASLNSRTMFSHTLRLQRYSLCQCIFLVPRENAYFTMLQFARNWPEKMFDSCCCQFQLDIILGCVRWRFGASVKINKEKVKRRSFTYKTGWQVFQSIFWEYISNPYLSSTNPISFGKLIIMK